MFAKCMQPRIALFTKNPFNILSSEALDLAGICRTLFSTVHFNGLNQSPRNGLRDTRGGGLSLPGLGSGLAWLGLAWSGLAWSGLAWSGLAWSGLAVYERRRSLCRPVMERETNA